MNRTHVSSGSLPLQLLNRSRHPHRALISFLVAVGSTSGLSCLEGPSLLSSRNHLQRRTMTTFPTAAIAALSESYRRKTFSRLRSTSTSTPHDSDEEPSPTSNHTRNATSNESTTSRGSTTNIQGRALQQHHRSTSREDRLAVLEEQVIPWTPQEEAEWAGLMQSQDKYFREQYSPMEFSLAHQAFKQAHNQAFCALAQYCQSKAAPQVERNTKNIAQRMFLFFLDGPDAGTVSALCNSGFSVAQCVVANRHASTCQALRKWGMPPSNVLFQSATEALTSLHEERRDGDSHDPAGGLNRDFVQTGFGAYYLDGCGGHAPLICDMLTATFSFHDTAPTWYASGAPIAIGFSVVGGGRDVVNKELQVVQHLVRLVQEHNHRYCAAARPRAVHHVLDDPTRWGVAEDLQKLEGSTLTTWLVIE